MKAKSRRNRPAWAPPPERRAAAAKPRRDAGVAPPRPAPGDLGAALQALLAPLPLLAGESQAEYDALRDRIWAPPPSRRRSTLRSFSTRSGKCAGWAALASRSSRPRR